MVQDSDCVQVSLNNSYGYDSSLPSFQQLSIGSPPSQQVNILVQVPSSNSISASDSERSTESYPLSYYENNLSSDQKEVPLDKRCVINNVISHLKSWEFTARVGFELSEPEICHLGSDYRNFKECAYQAYHKWMQSQGFCERKPLTAWIMLKVLHKAGEYEAINHLIKSLKE